MGYLSYIISIDYKNMVWCTFQVDPFTVTRSVMTITKKLNYQNLTLTCFIPFRGLGFIVMVVVRFRVMVSFW